MKQHIGILLTEGFEEIEAVIPADVFRRLNLDVMLIGTDTLDVTGAHDITLNADVTLETVSADQLSALVLPGGMPGAANLRDNPRVIRLIQAMNVGGKWLCANCASPIVFAKAGVINDKKVTCYPADPFINALSCAVYTGRRTERDGNIITGAGPGCAFEFSYAVAEALGLQDEVKKLKIEMQMPT